MIGKKPRLTGTDGRATYQRFVCVNGRVPTIILVLHVLGQFSGVFVMFEFFFAAGLGWVKFVWESKLSAAVSLGLFVKWNSGQTYGIVD